MGTLRDILVAAAAWTLVAGLAFGGSAAVHFPPGAGCGAGCETAVNTTAGDRGR